MKRSALAFVICAAPLLIASSCGPQRVHEKRLMVGVENARFQEGYLNSKLLGPGTLLLWDLGAAEDRKVTLEPGPDTTNNRDIKHAGGSRKVSMAASGLNIDGSVPSSEIPFAAKATVVRSTALIVEDFESRRFYDPTYVLNEEDFAAKRKELGEAYAANEDIRFIFISGVTVANNSKIEIGTPTGKENEFKLTIAGEDYTVTFSGARVNDWQGKSEPVFIQPRIYRIVKDSSGETGYRFVEDRNIIFDLTGMLSNATTF